MANEFVTVKEGTADKPEFSLDLVQCLKSPNAYPEHPTAVDIIETHISWVFLTDRFAYKLKKPVRFDFLDFSTPALRCEACKCEVELNRRLAPGVYLGVVPVATMDGQVVVDGGGSPVDWLVKMKRLPADNALDVLIRNQKTTSAMIDQLANTLSTFYENLPPVTLTVEEYRRRLEDHIIANRIELGAATHHLDLHSIRLVHSSQLCVMRLVPELLDNRVCNGRVIEGHGDLRPEHIYFDPFPLIIDCIEFNREFRVLDVVDEIAFLAMECDFLDANQVAEPVLQRYIQQSGDSPTLLLLDFYRCYRACVRAKVCALRAEQLSGEIRTNYLASATRYLSLAERYATSISKPLLVLVRGLPGTGKSTIAESLSDQLGFELLQTDVVRQTLFGSGGDHVDFNQGRYRPDNRLRVYEHMHKQAGQYLGSGVSVILDGTYLSAALRDEAAESARQYGAEFLALHCQCPDNVALERIRSRSQQGDSTSEARPEFFSQQRQAEEPEPPNQLSLLLDTSSNAIEPLLVAFDAIRQRCFVATLENATTVGTSS